MSDPEYNAARRAKGLRAVAQGLNINLDLEVAIVCLNHAADKIEELEREREELKEQLDAAIMLGKMQERRHERELEQVREQYRLSSVCRKLLEENKQLKGES